MYKYDYTDIDTEPDMDDIETDIAASAMEDKAEYAGMNYIEAQELLEVGFNVDISSGDKTILDQIVADNT